MEWGQHARPMLFVRKAALRPVPPWAVVDENAIGAVEDSLGDDSDEGGTESELQSALDAAYREMDRLQPALARFLAEEVAEREDDLAQSVGYFLVVTVHMAFREAFPTRMKEIDQNALEMAIATLDADEELRKDDSAEMMESDDVVAMTQPALLHFVQHHLEQALEQAGGESDLEAFDTIYRAVLVEVVALSHAVQPPEGVAPTSAGLA
jgi:hypothetical protein